METLHALFGKSDQLTTLQMCIRGVLVFISALIILRIGAARTFGKETVVDNVVVIILGGILSRVITGAAAFIPVMAATFSIILAHRLLAWICMGHHAFGNLVKGKKRILFINGELQEQHMKKVLVSKEDIVQAIRFQLNEADLKDVKEVVMERNGKMSVVKKDVE